jgi:hypothetical protein
MTLISTCKYVEGKKTTYYGKSNNLVTLIFKNRHDGSPWVLNLTTPLALLLTD